MLSASDEKRFDITSVSVPPIVITPAQIRNVISTYKKLKHESWTKSYWPWFIGSRMENQECDFIQQLRAFLLSSSKDASTALDQAELFKLASLLSSTLSSKDKVLTEAVKPLVDRLGKNRIEVTKELDNENLGRTLELFGSLCRIPDNRAPLIAGLYLIDKKFTLSPETIALCEKHSDRFEELEEFLKDKDTKEERKKINKIITMFDQLQVKEYFVVDFMKNKKEQQKFIQSKLNEFYGYQFSLLFAMIAFLLSFLRESTNPANNASMTFLEKLTGPIDPVSNASVTLFLNQLIAAALQQNEHMIEAIYAIMWLENHGINTKENESLVYQHPTDLSYLPEIGFSVKDKEVDQEFNQKLFLFAMNEGIKKPAYPGKLFDKEIKASADDNVLPLPVLMRSPSK